MNHSIYSADRTTHLKVVIVALIAGILVAGFGIWMRNSSDRPKPRAVRQFESRQPGDQLSQRRAIHLVAARESDRQAGNSRGILTAPQVAVTANWDRRS